MEPQSQANVVSRLYRSGQRHAQRAAEHLAVGREDDGMGDAGICLEHLAKATLASRHLLLVVGSKGAELDLEGMQWALGGHLVGMPPGKTITATEALRRCGALLPALRSTDLRPVLDARNGVLHLGSGAPHDLENVVARLAKAADVLLPEIGHDSRSLWGHFADTIEARLEGRRDRVAHIVADKLALARQRSEAAFKTVGPTGLNALRGALQQHQFGSGEMAVDCPACSVPAIAVGNLQIQEISEVDRDGFGDEAVDLVGWLHIETVKCHACGLFLEGLEQVEAAEIDSVQATGRPVDPWDYYGA